jgi:hypothetical protein
VKHAQFLSNGDNHVKFLQKAEEHGLDPHLHALLALENDAAKVTSSTFLSYYTMPKQ